MRKRIAYSQNFLKNKGLISYLLKKSSVSSTDIVYEIGAGQGIITEALLKKSKKVIAFEIDENLFNKLTQRFQGNKSLELQLGNFLTHPLPIYPYKVFSNIPFNLTSAIIKMLTQTLNPPSDCYLIVQKEAAKKFIGQPYDVKNSQMAILLKPWFNLKVFYEFKRDDFFPKPQVDTILLRIKKLDTSLIKAVDKNIFQDFVVYSFNQFQPNVVEGLASIFGKETLIDLSRKLNFSPNSKPSELDFNQWLGLFNYFSDKLKSKHNLVKGSLAKLNQQQNKLAKIHRTRTDKNWKQFRQK